MAEAVVAAAADDDASATAVVHFIAASHHFKHAVNTDILANIIVFRLNQLLYSCWSIK